MKKTFTVPSLESDAAYAAALEVRQRVRAKVSDLDREEANLHQKIARQKVDINVDSNGVAALLGDPLSEELDRDGPHARLRAIHVERADARRALEIAEQRLQTARFAASKVVMDGVKDEYADRVRALAATIVAANTAHEQLLSLISDLNSKDIAWSAACEPMQMHNVFGDHGARVGAWLKSAKRAGFIDMVPKEFTI